MAVALTARAACARAGHLPPFDRRHQSRHRQTTGRSDTLVVEILVILSYSTQRGSVGVVHVFPAQVPAAEAHRSDIVEVRLARKVASLFGVSRDIPPFRRSWVCDYTA